MPQLPDCCFDKYLGSVCGGPSAENRRAKRYESWPAKGTNPLDCCGHDVMQRDGAKARVGTWSCRSSKSNFVTCPPMDDAPAIVAVAAMCIKMDGCSFLEQTAQGIRNTNAGLSLIRLGTVSLSRYSST